jgi:hypothetical protein
MYYYKFFNVIYENTNYKDKTFNSENLWVNVKVYLFV